MNHQNKLTSQQQADEQQHAATRQDSQATPVLEFANADELLRHDALHTPVPPRVGERLAKSIEQEPRPSSSWWRRLFGGHKP